MTFLSNIFNRNKPQPVDSFSGRLSIREQLDILDADLTNLGYRVGTIGLAIRNDHTEVVVTAPPVVTLQDAIEYLNTRVDFVNRLLDTVEDKLGF